MLTLHQTPKRHYITHSCLRKSHLEDIKSFSVSISNISSIYTTEEWLLCLLTFNMKHLLFVLSFNIGWRIIKFGKQRGQIYYLFLESESLYTGLKVRESASLQTFSTWSRFPSLWLSGYEYVQIPFSFAFTVIKQNDWNDPSLVFISVTTSSDPPF